MTRLAEGDRDAFAPVFSALHPLLRRFAARSLPEVEADDAAQEALVRVFFRATEFDPTRDALSWALGIAAYEIKSSRRRRGRRREDSADATGREDPAPSPEDQAIAANLDAVLDAALSALGPADEATLRAYAHGRRPEGIAPATFRKRVERGLQRLRALWRATHDGDR
jgi:RNA polymerase sigma factor (sigma-70 family)